MSRITSHYPERVYSSSETDKPSLRERIGGKKMSAGWLLAGLAAVGLGAWAAYHFGPDFRRYMKMERM